MISLSELNPHAYATTSEQDANLAILLERINKVRTAWGKPMTVTSGLRSEADQQRINPSAPRSKHLLGCAVDIADGDGSLSTWCKANEALLAGVGLWMEERQGGWQHFQTMPPASGHLWFKP